MLFAFASPLAMALCLGLGSLQGADSRPGAVTPASAADESPRAIKALELYKQQRMLEAAVAFEGLWQDFRVPAYLFNAAIARERLGHEALAYVHLRRFLAEPISADEQAKATRRTEDLKLRTVLLQIEVSAPKTEGLSFVLQKMPAEDPIKVDALLIAAPGAPGTYQIYVDAGSWVVSPVLHGYRDLKAIADVQPATPATVSFTMEPGFVPFALVVEPPDALTAGVHVRVIPKTGGAPQDFELGSLPTDWALAPGEYSVELSAPNFRPATVEINLRAGQVPPTLVLEPIEAPPTPSADASSNGRAIGFGTVSAALLVGGGVTLGASMPRYASSSADYLTTSKKDSLTPYEWQDDLRSLRRNLRGQATGFMLVGGALGGLLATALTPLKNRRQVALAQIGVGMGILVGSTVAYAVTRKQLDTQFGADYAFLSSKSPRVGELSSTAGLLTSRTASSNAAAFFLGTGAAMLSAGLVEWFLHSRKREHPRLNLSAGTHRHGGTLTISGAF